MEREPVKMCVVGAGASGLAAAATGAKMLGGRGGVLIVERKDTLGKKLLATGSGRCNLTNIYAEPDDYFGDIPSFVRPALEAYGPSKVMDYFNSLGLLLSVEEEGRVYPYTGQSASVKCLLKRELIHERVGILKNIEIKKIYKENGLFVLSNGKNKEIRAQKVILAAGGCAQPAFGSNGSGFTLLQSMGHRIIPPFPALVQIKTDGPTAILKGLHFQAAASVMEDGKILERRQGNLLFTAYGLSGIPILELSRLVSISSNTKRRILRLDFLPTYSQQQVSKLLIEGKRNLGHLTAEDFLTGFLSRPLGHILACAAGVAADKPLSEADDTNLRKLISIIKAFDLNIEGTNGFESAQVTGGGAACDEFKPETMESRLVKGLYCAGEILDIYGCCGGYNLQWAWASGILAGESAAKEFI